MTSKSLDYLNTVTSMQHVLKDLELSLDRTRAEDDNEWRIRYDIHSRYKRCLEMRAHRTADRVKILREALRDGGLEFHRDYRTNSEMHTRRVLETLDRERMEKLSELQRKEDIMEREAKILKQERQRKKLLLAELESVKLGSDGMVWSDVFRPELREIFNEKRDEDLYTNGKGTAAEITDKMDGVDLSSRQPRQWGLPSLDLPPRN